MVIGNARTNIASRNVLIAQVHPPIVAVGPIRPPPSDPNDDQSEVEDNNPVDDILGNVECVVS